MPHDGSQFTQTVRLETVLLPLRMGSNSITHLQGAEGRAP